MPARAVGAEHAGADVALGQHGVAGEVLVRERHRLGRRDGGLEALHVDVAVAGDADGQRLARAVGVLQHHDDVLQRVRRRPLAVGEAQVVAGVQQVDERGDRRRAGRVVVARRRGVVVRQRVGRRDPHGLDVRRVRARLRAHERVLADVERGEELLARRAAHRARHRGDDHVRQAEAVERLDVGVAVALVGDLEPGVVDVEAVGVLHHELAAAQQAGAGPGLVAVLRLDLVDAQRQVLVRRVQVLDEQREHLLVRRRHDEVVAAPVLEAEHVVAVIGPAAGRLVGLLRQQGREVDLLEARRVHLLADDALDVAVDEPPERQPREPAGCGAADVPGAHHQAVARHLGVGRIVPQGPEEQRRHAQHGATYGAATDSLRPALATGDVSRSAYADGDRR